MMVPYYARLWFLLNCECDGCRHHFGREFDPDYAWRFNPGFDEFHYRKAKDYETV